IAATYRSKTDTMRQNFHLRWIGMPFSLRNLQTAVDALEYTAPEKEFKEMRSANPRKQKLLFEEFWKKRDPTPGTAFNEVMEEYYRRVDHASTAFSTLRQ